MSICKIPGTCSSDVLCIERNALLRELKSHIRTVEDSEPLFTLVVRYHKLRHYPMCSLIVAIECENIESA